ncbi:MAG: choline ABC transporter ATP-binding protein [Janthinobacterium lividum]
MSNAAAEPTPRAAISFEAVDIVFGPNPKRVLPLLDAGRTRDEILAETGHVVGVAGATLAVAPGEICVLMGLSGSGKSTLLRAVNRLNRPARGRVVVAQGDRDVEVCSCDGKTLRDLRSRGVAMVFQQFALLPWRSVRDNVGMGLELRGMGRKARDAIVDEKLAMVGLEQWADKYTHELSGGMQQRVGLARAFATDADILLMDEPFSALDPLIRARLQDELLELQAKLKKTIVFVSHDLDEAAKLGNRIVIMEGGRIVQAGSVADIVMNPADAYVTAFVRHLNPLEALRASAFMTPLSALARADGALVLGPGLHCRLDRDGRLASSQSDAIVAVADTMPLKAAMALHRRGAHVLVVTDIEGRVVGAAHADDLFRALLRN